ncbi:MAG: amidohydrolase family protein [Actinomycetota bacterium]|nr:amidohydrolase family protein [Actinomycetota bacterium]
MTEPTVEATTGPAAPPALADAGPEPAATRSYPLVIKNGRVIDPQSGFDGVVDLAVEGAKIAAIGPGLAGAQVIDATGKVVAPGFIDLLSAEPDPFGVWFKVGDGVTTNLAMHGVNNYANAFFARYSGTTPIHYGGAWHQHFIRSTDAEVGAVKPNESLRAEQLAAFAALTDFNLSNGLAGICFSPEYSPGTTLAEMEEVAAVAAARGHALFFHVRYSDPDAPGTSFEAIEEVLQLARTTGAAVHIEHLPSTGGTFVMAQTLEMLEAARAEGIKVTADLYPYDFWGTTLASERFVGDWQARYRIGFENLQVAGTSRRLSSADFDQAVQDNLLVAALGTIPEDEVQMALRVPWIMIGSDAILTESLNHHPRAAGTFARVLGRYVRDLGILSLGDALAKMTILPAQLMEPMIPAMARKGRLQRGADADIVVFDPATIADRATVESPASMSAGIWQVLVDGQLVLADGMVQRQLLPGRPLRSA